MEAKEAEFEIWEDEAGAFYFDLQISSIQGVLYENKVHELTEVCGSLEDQTISRSQEIEGMKTKLSSMEREIGGLKAELSAYEPIIASLRNDIISLEQNVLLQTKLRIPADTEAKCVEFLEVTESFRDKSSGEQQALPSGVQDLQKLQSKIKAVEKTMVEEIKKLVSQETPKLGDRQGTVRNKIKELKNQGGLIHRKVKEKKEHETNVNSSGKLALRKGTSMKDIPLDRISEPSSHRLRRRANSATDRADDKILELWEAAEESSLNRVTSFRQKPSFAAPGRDLLCIDPLENMRWKTEHPSAANEVEKELSIDKLEVSSGPIEPNQDASNMKILERLASDARRLTSLQFTVENLTRKLDEKQKRKKAKDVDLETVKEQLQEVQETVIQLVEFNGKLMGNVGESPFSSEEKGSGELKESPNVKRKKVSEQARKGSERIGRLQVEVQKIEYVLLKLDDEKKAKVKGRFSKNRTSIILRDFIYNGRKNSGKKRKSRLCGCFRSSSTREQIRV